MSIDKVRGKALLLSVLALSVMWIVGCGKSDDVRDFSSEIGKTHHADAAAPDTPPELSWDFSGTDVYAYDYEQQAEFKTRMSPELMGEGETDQTIEGGATMLLKSQGDGTATLVMKDFAMKMLMGNGGVEKEMTSTPPPIVAPGVKEDGSMNFLSASNNLVPFLFSLPGKPLRVGESVEIPATMPFNAMGSALNAEGTIKLTLTGYVTIDGRLCARLESDIDISRLDVPEELPGTYECAMTGKGVIYFDVEQRHFVQLEQAMRMSVSIETAVPEVEMEGAEGLFPDGIDMAIEMSTLIRLTWNPDKAE